MNQPSLFQKTTPNPLTPGLRDIPGETYDQERDHARLASQHEQVLAVLRRGGWWTIPEMQAAGVKGAGTGISARIRGLRDEVLGGHRIESRPRTGMAGTWEYCLLPKDGAK